MNADKYVIGVDYGTDSVRTLIVNAVTGDEVACSVFEYPRWKDRLYCDAAENRFRQHPLDYVEGLEKTIKECVKIAGQGVAANILAISIDTTGSTPCAVNERGVPLALLPEFEHNPNAMFVLWKDHTAIKEADEINAQSARSGVHYVAYSGGIYSPEWFWAKLLHVLRQDEAVRKQCVAWVEHSDWMPFLLTGATDVLQMKRNVCAAGHKGLWAAEHGGFPPDDFFASIDPLLKGYVLKMDARVYTADQAAGNLCGQWAERLGLSTNVKIGIGAIDAHVGAIGGQIEPYVMSKVIGTSTCDMLVIPKADMKGKLIRGISGQVDGSIIPGMIGLEAGQSAFGDIYAWFKELLLWPLKNMAVSPEDLKKLSSHLLQKLGEEAAAIEFDENSEIAVDWFNGRRTPDVDPLLKGAFAGLTLGTNAPALYRALVESTCFGAKKIIERYRDEGIQIKGIIALGGIPRKSEFVMQSLADILEMPIKVNASGQTCALGATMLAATVAGIYNNVHDAMKSLGKGFDKYFKPNADLEKMYRTRFAKYNHLCNAVEEQAYDDVIR